MDYIDMKKQIQEMALKAYQEGLVEEPAEM